MLFLLYTAITGIVYIALEFSPDYTPEKTKLLLRMHSFASLYGWNLSGLASNLQGARFSNTASL